MKNVLVDMLLENGFSELPQLKAIPYDHILVSRTWTKKVNVAWHGEMETTLKVNVFVNLHSGIAWANFSKDGQSPYKSRWYDTTGKRTYNAIVATIQNAGFEM